MLAIDLVKLTGNILKSLSEIGIRTSDYRYIDLYDEYTRMVSQGIKKDYVKAVLADKYKTSESSIYRIVTRLESQVKI